MAICCPRRSPGRPWRGRNRRVSKRRVGPERMVGRRKEEVRRFERVRRNTAKAMKLLRYAPLLLIVFSVGLALWFYPTLPAMMTSHWNAKGEADSVAPKFWVLFLIPMVMAALTAIFALIRLPFVVFPGSSSIWRQGWALAVPSVSCETVVAPAESVGRQGVATARLAGNRRARGRPEHEYP